MTECFIYDHVRTPRGRGRPDGALHEVPPIDLAAGVLRSRMPRNTPAARSIAGTSCNAPSVRPRPRGVRMWS